MNKDSNVAKNNLHPCYSREAHHKYFRLHLPVAPECNLGCNFCEKRIGGMTYHAYRPAVTKEILNPLQALDRVAFYSSNTDKLKVVGIAGPGEPLANEQTFDTLELIGKLYPDMILCLSTNGILLSQCINRLKGLGIHSISVTINSLNINTLVSLYQYVYTEEQEKLVAHESACYIGKKQLEALECLAVENIQYKVNTILIPGINDSQVEEIAKTIAYYKAKLHNIIPFIPLGTLSNIDAPSCDELIQARNASEKYIKQFRLCKQCSSDAFDIPGRIKKAYC